MAAQVTSAELPPIVQHESCIEDCVLVERLARSRVEIPLIQRPYDWKPVNVDALCDDIAAHVASGAAMPFNLGSIRCAKPADGGGLLLVTDGQQRITTVVLILRAMWDFIDTANVDAALRDKVRALCEPALRVPDTSLSSASTHVPRVRHSFAPMDHFLAQVQLLEEVDKPTHGAVEGAYKAYMAALAWLRSSARRDLRGTLIWFNELCHNVRAQLVLYPTLGEAERGFELANCRGVGVSDTHLLRAMLIGRLPEGTEDRLRFSADWESATQAIVAAGAKMDKFLRTFAAVKYPNRDFKGKIAPKFVAAGAADDVVAFGVEVRDAAGAYARIFRGDRPGGGRCAPLVDTLTICASNDAGNALALILAARHAEPAAFDRLAHAMFAYQLVKRVVGVNRDQTAPFLAKFLPLFAETRTLADAELVADTFVAALSERWGREMRDDLERRSLHSKVDVARMLVAVAEDALQEKGTPRFAPTTPRSDRYAASAGVSIEHILCQALSDPAVAEFATSRDEAAVWVWRLGNLTFLHPSENAAAGDRPYLQKRGIYRGTSHLVSTLTAGRTRVGVDTRLDRLASVVTPVDVWDVDACRLRGAQLADVICEALGLEASPPLRLAV